VSKRKAKRPDLALRGLREPKPLPWPLDAIEWSDKPALAYDPVVLKWIADKAGERGQLNVWRCEQCSTPVLCYDKHPGTTPFMVAHSTLGGGDCTGICKSAFYSSGEVIKARSELGGPGVAPSHEWYRPAFGDPGLKEAAVRAHVIQGGLLVRETRA
jgi:hypothetical protein